MIQQESRLKVADNTGEGSFVYSRSGGPAEIRQYRRYNSCY